MENLELLVLLDGDIEAQKLVATWPNVPRSEDEDATNSAWAELSGVDIFDVAKLAPVLFRNGLCGPDGFVDPDAAAYIRQRIAKLLPKASRP